MRSDTDHPRLMTARNALLWVAIIVLALLPIPWW
jgi:hypothetical protein